MRVIAGKFRGVALRGGKGPQFRPTAQVVKGSIFDSLYSEVQGAVILDLFAGSGSLGIEALSRGASRVRFIEQDSTAIRALRTNIERCRIEPAAAEVRNADAVKFLEKAIKSGDNYDIILADPPYASQLGKKLADMISISNKPVCRYFIVETGQEFDMDEKGSLEKIRTRKFGQTVITYLRFKDIEDRDPE
ncbi:MAG: 16S rRNA (guanine(966)-N(2))-methyltransferase RsmD [Candidatus Krumholzibacteriota bacterium]|nr:16S rRNA (guanine(966)-N(2))-methyltransferase RsmD [Candidatus Krumholzibacteriota bacterium]